MTVTDIFIKTYHKDFVWLEYALKSIQKFASGFRDVVIVTDDGHKIPETMLNIMPVKVFYVPLPDKKPSYVEHGLGYLWQQYIKLTWYNYSDADAAYIFDSDEMFTKPTTPDSFKTDGKFHWVYRDWEKAGNGKCWKESTDMMLTKETRYDAMCITGFILQKTTSIALKNHLCSKHNTDDIWNIIINKNMKTCSEFNIYGSFIDLYGRKEYTKLINIDTKHIHNKTIHKEWSWGGLTPEKMNKITSILTPEYPSIIKFAIYSIKRSGRHIVEEFLTREGFKFCGCNIDDPNVTKPCYDTAVHLKHESIKPGFDFNRIKKCIVLYRKDVVEQIDAILRLQFYQKQKGSRLTDTKEHISCDYTPDLNYSKNVNSIEHIYNKYKLFCKEAVDTKRDNCLVIDFDELVVNREDTLKKILFFLDPTATIDEIKYDDTYSKKNMHFESYEELKGIIDSFKHPELSMSEYLMSTSKTLDERELCDLECLLNGSFAPLNAYMNKLEYAKCLGDPSFYPIPIVCSVSSEISVGTPLLLKDVTGLTHATLTVSECWKPDLTSEWNAVFGCDDDTHPYISYTKTKGDIWYVSGDIVKNTPISHSSFSEYRRTPEQVRALGPFIGFQTRNPLHRSHIELIKRSAGDIPILLHPVEGVTQECDIPFPVRMQCYKNTLPHLGNVTLSILTLSMRMAGPREAVWHAGIRRNYGCSHFIVGRDHAGPSYKKKDGSSFYGPLEAQKLAKSLEPSLGIQIVTSEEVVYCEDIDEYKTLSESVGHTVKNISGTLFRSMLEKKETIPSWYSYPEVIQSLQTYYTKPKGVCFYFVGLSGSGKSTLANALKSKINEEFPSREVTILDADEIRTHLSKGLGFTKEDRSTNVRRIGYVASEIVKHGGIVVVANIAPYQEDREFNRALISKYGNYIQFFVDTPIEVCEERDVKGLYKAARAGTLKGFTGVSDPFELPTNGIQLVLSDIQTTNNIVWKKSLIYL